MEQNPEEQITPNEPLFEPAPAVEPIPDPSPAVTSAEEAATAAAEQVIDVQPTADEPSWATVGTAPAPAEQPLKPEIVGGPAQQAPKKSSNGWVIALVILLVVCCCCVLFIGPLLFATRILGSILGGLYNAIINVLNSIFNGSVQFY